MTPPPRLLLAPLADFTDSPFRLMGLAGGADGAYTEMVSAAALAHSHNPTRILLAVLPGEPPPACQIFGANESEIAYATRLVTGMRRFREINLNAGCPVAKVTRSGAGAVLAKSPETTYRLLKAMAENTDLPVTLKTRLGPAPDAVRIFELVDAAAHAGASAVIVHARFTSQMHGGSTHLDILAETVARSAIPVIGNGSIVDAASASAMVQTGVAALMLGRAVLSRPDVFVEIRRTLSGGSAAVPFEPSIERAKRLFLRHLELVVAFHAHLVASLPDVRVPTLDAFAALKVRTHMFRYFSGIPGAAALRARFNAVRSLDDIHAAVACAAS